MNKKVMQTANANPHHKTKSIYNIALYYVGCKELIKEAAKSLLGGIVLMSVFTPLIIHIIRSL